MSDDLLYLRAQYVESIRRGKELCTYADMLDTEAYTLYCRSIFQNYFEEIRRLNPMMTFLEITDFLNRG